MMNDPITNVVTASELKSGDWIQSMSYGQFWRIREVEITARLVLVKYQTRTNFKLKTHQFPLDAKVRRAVKLHEVP